jgi:hypothetical protein
MGHTLSDLASTQPSCEATCRILLSSPHAALSVSALPPNVAGITRVHHHCLACLLRWGGGVSLAFCPGCSTCDLPDLHFLSSSDCRYEPPYLVHLAFYFLSHKSILNRVKFEEESIFEFLSLTRTANNLPPSYLLLVLVFETGTSYVPQACLELEILLPQPPGITGMCHHA